MNRMKHLFGICGILMLIFVLLVMTASAEANIVDEGQCGEQVYWTLDDQGILTISGSGDVSNGSYRDAHQEDIISVVVKDGVTGICDYAFYDCKNLHSIVLSNSVESLGDYSFGKCGKISSVWLTDNVKIIGKCVFSDCVSLKSIYIPSSVTEIHALDRRDSPFYGCSSLEMILCEANEKKNGWGEYWNYYEYWTGIMPSYGVDSYSAKYWNALDKTQRDIDIPDGVRIIPVRAFYACKNLTSIHIPNSVIKVYDDAFYGCSNFQTLYIDSIDSWVKMDSLSGWTNPGLNASCDYYVNGELLTELTIPYDIEYVKRNAFAGCKSIKTVVIPNTVTCIGEGAFRDCKNLENVTIQNGVLSIGPQAFGDCEMLRTLTIPDSVTSIGDYTFINCCSLSNVTISKKVINIDDGVFYGCTSLMNITVPDNVTNIGQYAFCMCDCLGKITIPESVSSIADDAFSDISPTFFCYEYSYADGWATEHGLSVCYLDSETVPVQMQLPESYILPIGQIETIPISLFPDDVYDLVWTSSDPSIVSVDNGKLTGHEKGTVTITVSCTRNDESELEASSLVTCYVPLESFSLNPAEVWVVAKESYQVLPVVVPTDAEEPFTWKSSNTTIATVSESGLATTKAVGDVTITATSRGGLTQTMLLHCCYPVQSIAFEPAELQMNTDPVQLQATVTDTRGGTYVNKLITFTTSSPDIVTIDENGMLYPHKGGTAEITATSSNGKTATCTVTVGVDGHIPVTTIEAIEPTCTNPGRSAEIICSDCGETLSVSEVIPALGHDTVTHKAQEPTCTDIGWNAYETCRRCDYTTYAEIPALEHDIQAYEAQEPTCTEDGHEAYEACSRCDYTTCVIIPALGHDTVTHEAQAPTCTEIGWEAYETCSRCDYSTYVELPALGHTVVTDSYIAPTRTSGGMTAGSHCSVCNEILEGNEYIAPLVDAPIVIVPEAVEGLGEEAYMSSGVVCVRLPDGCKYLGSRAFAQCTSLQVIEIPASVMDIADNAFEGSPNVTIVTTNDSYAEKYAEQYHFGCYTIN